MDTEKTESRVEKYKIWDTQKKEWFRPIYPGFKADKNNKQIEVTETREILFSQSGEMFLHHHDKDIPSSLTHIPVPPEEKDDDATSFLPLFIPCRYTGVKDENEKKLYVGDIVSNEVAKWEVVFNRGCYSAKMIDSSNRDESLTHLALRAIKGIEYVGNKLENPDLIKPQP